MTKLLDMPESDLPPLQWLYGVVRALGNPVLGNVHILNNSELVEFNQMFEANSDLELLERLKNYSIFARSETPGSDDYSSAFYAVDRRSLGIICFIMTEPEESGFISVFRVPLPPVTMDTMFPSITNALNYSNF